MRAFEENSQQGGGGALEVAGDIFSFLCAHFFGPPDQVIWTQNYKSFTWNLLTISFFQTSCRDDPAKEACIAKYQKIQSFKKPALPPLDVGGGAA